MSLTGPDKDHPTRVGVPIGDILSGLNGTIGILAALLERANSGQGRVVRTSLLASIIGAHAFQGTKWTVAHELGGPSGNHHPQIAPYGTFSCADGFVQIAVGSEPQWRSFAPIVGIEPDDARFATNTDRMANRPQLWAMIDRALERHSREHWLKLFAEAGVPAGSIRTIDEVYEWDQTRQQGLVIAVDHPTLGTIELPGPSLQFETLDGERTGRQAHVAPPRLGQHTAQIKAAVAADD